MHVITGSDALCDAHTVPIQYASIGLPQKSGIYLFLLQGIIGGDALCDAYIVSRQYIGDACNYWKEFSKLYYLSKAEIEY